jgi:hypothetical protein
MDDDLLAPDIEYSSELVTVATFDDPVSASFALNRLKNAGLPAVLSDENAVSMDWLLSNAIGGIKVQVNPKDAQAARCLLEQHEPLTAADDAAAAAEPGDGEAADDELTGLFIDRPGQDVSVDDAPENTDDDMADERPLTERERNADRALRGAILGIVVPLIQPYVLYLLYRVFDCDDSLDAVHKRRATAAGVISFVVLFGFYCLLRGL